MEKEHQVTTLEKIERKLGFDSRVKMAKALGISETTLSEGFNRSNSRMMASSTRRTVAEGLGRHCKSEEELRELVEETEWEMTDEEWERALDHITGEEDGLHEVPRLSGKQMVGRGDELDELQRWLRGEGGATERIMVVQGIGGVGKTVLVIQAVRELNVDQWYRDGVYWVRMERCGDEEGIREFARQVLGADAMRGPDVWRATESWLKGKRALIVLDGVNERIGLDGWGDVLPARGRLLATSRVTGLEGARIRSRTLKVSGLEKAESLELLTRGVEVDASEDELEWVENELGGLPLALYLGNRIGRQIKGLKGFVEGLRVESGQVGDVEHKERTSLLADRAETARARWMAGQTLSADRQASPERAELRLLRIVPLSDDPDEAMRALEERMELAEKVQDQNAWLADALRCGFLLVRQGNVEQAKAVLLEADLREAEMNDARFDPWVNLLESHVAWTLGRDEEGEQAYQEAAEELADVFGETVLWKVPVDEMAGETTAERAVEVWRRALRVEDPFRYVDAACRVYPVFVQLSRDELPQDEAEREKQYEAEREGLRWKGIELPDWDWFIEKDDASGAGNEAVAENNATEETH